MFKILPGKASSSGRFTNRMKPARQIHSTPAARNLSTTTACFSSGNFVRNPPQSITSPGMPAFFARSKIYASGLSDKTKAIRALSVPASIASMIACMFDPLPEPKIPRTMARMYRSSTPGEKEIPLRRSTI